MDKRHFQAEKNLEDLKSSVNDATLSVMKKLEKELGKEGFSKWAKFNDKYIKLVMSGRNREAELLKEKYLKDNS